MDLGSAVVLRELGFSQRFSTVTDVLEERAEESLLQSSLVHKAVVFPNGELPVKTTFIAVCSPNGLLVASSHGDHVVYVTDARTGRVVHSLRGHRRTPWSLAFHPSRSDLLASGCLAGQVRVWDLQSGCSETLQLSEEMAVASLAFHPDNRLLVIAVGNRLLFWDWKDIQPKAHCAAADNERVRYVKFDATGFRLYTAITNVPEQAESVAQGRQRATVPPEIMPYRCQELLRSRRELLDMRSELSERHNQLLQRYQNLLARYEYLRGQYRDLDIAGDEANEAAARHRNPLDRPTLRPEADGRDPFLADVTPETSTSALSSFQMEPSSRYSRVLPPHHVQSTSSATSSPADSLGSLELERLDDAVAYAHQLTQTSMQQFLAHHEASMSRLQRSYLELQRSANTLVDNFRRTYDDMCRLQSRIGERLGVPVPDDHEQEGSARALLDALTRMQGILLTRADAPVDEPNSMPLDRETVTLLEVYDSLLDGIRDDVPRITRVNLEQSRQRVLDIRGRIQHGQAERNIDAVQRELTVEIHTFQQIIREWKAHVVARLRERRRDMNSAYRQGTSGTGGRVMVALNLPPPTQISSSSNASVSTDRPATVVKRRPDDQPSTSTSVSGAVAASSSQSDDLSPTTAANRPEDGSMAKRRRLDPPSSSGNSAMYSASSSAASSAVFAASAAEIAPPPPPPPPPPPTAVDRRLIELRSRLASASRAHARSPEADDDDDNSNDSTDGTNEMRSYTRSALLRLRHRRRRLNDLTPNVTGRAGDDDSDQETVYDLHRTINRAIAGAFIGSGDVAIANNIMDMTCRIQSWAFSNGRLPDLLKKDAGVLVKRCKLHNDGSVAFSRDGQLLACFVENADAVNPVWADTVLHIVSLRPPDLGGVLLHRTFGPNAIAVSWSPAGRHLLVGLATRRYLRLRHPPETIAQIYRICNLSGSENERRLKLVRSINLDLRDGLAHLEGLGLLMATRNSSLNCITWLPHAGHGFVYGTNKGQLYLIRQDQGPDRPHSVEGTADDDYPISRNDWRILPSPSAVTNVL